MESKVFNFICSEKCEPKRSFIKNETQLFAFVLGCVFLIIALGNYLYNHFGVPKGIVQLSMYFLVAMGALYLYRHHLTDFNYVLTEKIFVVERVIGKKIRPELQFHVADILKIYAYEDLPKEKYIKKYRLYHGKTDNVLCVVFKESDEKKLLMFSPTDNMKQALMNQWKKTKH